MRFALPSHAHIPGRNARHPPNAFEDVKAATPAETIAAEAPRNPAWRFGLTLLARGYFWECHEVLEPVWLNAAPNSRERAAVRAVIQLANAALKVEMERPTAAARLCDMASALFHEAGDGAMGLDLAGALRAVDAARRGRPHSIEAFWIENIDP